MTIVTRGQWGAKPANCSTPLISGVRGLAVHYSAADSDEEANHANCKNRVKGIQSFHMGPQRGWCDIAYSHLLCLHGAVFEGRGFGKRTAANGTNTGNARYFAVCFLGNDNAGRQDFTAEARQGLVDLRKEYLKRYPNAKETVGHRDITSTECPGDEIYAYINSASFKAAFKSPKRLPGPSPKPLWFWLWADWYLGGKKGPRPDAPQTIPKWAWQALEEWQAQH